MTARIEYNKEGESQITTDLFDIKTLIVLIGAGIDIKYLQMTAIIKNIEIPEELKKKENISSGKDQQTIFTTNPELISYLIKLKLEDLNNLIIVCLSAEVPDNSVAKQVLGC